MKINFTKTEYRLLVEMLTISDWVMNSRCIGDEAIHQKHRVLRNKIFSHYKVFEAEDILDSGVEKDQYYEMDKLLDHIQENFMSPYQEDIFWDELIHRLSLRDVINQIGMDNYSNMDGFERISITEDAKKPYIDEFTKNDLENVIIKLSTEK